MIDFFIRSKIKHNYPIKKYGNIEYIKRMYMREINKIQDYYRNRNSRVATNHPLSKLIYIVSPDYNLPIVKYFNMVDARAKFISKQFSFSSTINKGVIVNIFYKGAPELILYVESEYDIFNFKNNWKNMQPIKILNTEDTNLDYRLFTRELDYQGIDFPVFQVDVIMMCLMYKYWALERLNLDKSTHPSYFIYSVIFPSMLSQHMDLIILNRMMGIYYDNLFEEDSIRHPIKLTGYTKSIDSLIKICISDIKDKPIKLEQLIYSIPTITKNMLDVLKIDAPYYNRQNEWVLWLSRFRYILFFLDLLGERGRNNNRSIMNDLSISMRYIENGSTNIFNQIPNLFQDRVITYMEKIKEICGKR